MNPAVSEVAAVGALTDVSAQAAGAAAPAAPAGGFATWFDGQVNQLNTQLVQAEQGVQQLAAGDAASLHDVMIRMEEAKLSFQLAVQFRARILEAYQDVMRMQV
jgi:flagellar hook-basal body complex protein FliE